MSADFMPSKDPPLNWYAAKIVKEKHPGLGWGFRVFVLGQDEGWYSNLIMAKEVAESMVIGVIH